MFLFIVCCVGIDRYYKWAPGLWMLKNIIKIKIEYAKKYKYQCRYADAVAEGACMGGWDGEVQCKVHE